MPVPADEFQGASGYEFQLTGVAAEALGVSGVSPGASGGGP